MREYEHVGVDYHFSFKGLRFHRSTDEEIAEAFLSGDSKLGAAMVSHRDNHDFYENVVLPKFQAALETVNAITNPFLKALARHRFKALEEQVTKSAKLVAEQKGYPEDMKKPHEF